MCGCLIRTWNKRFWRKGTRGSLLLEALLATIILSVSLTVIIQSMTAGLRVMADGTRYVALNLLESKMAEFRRGDRSIQNVNTQDYFSEPYGDYQYSLQTRFPSQERGTKIREATLNVSWDTGRRKGDVGVTTYFLDAAD